MNRKRDLFLSAFILTVFITGAIPQLAAQESDGAMKRKPATNSGVVLKDRGTDFKLPISKGKPGSFTPQLALLGAESKETNGKPYSWITFTIKNWESFPTPLFKPAPELPPCGQNKNSARTWLTIYNSDTNAYIYGYCGLESPAELKNFGYAIPKGQQKPKQVYVILTDRQTNTVYQSNCINALGGGPCSKP